MKIRTLEQLQEAALDRKACIVKGGCCWSKRHLPAAWLINLRGCLLVRLLREGIFIYKPKTKTRTKPNHVQ